MKSKVKFPLILSFALLCLMSGCDISLDNRWEVIIPVPLVKIEDGKLSAENDLDFGKIIATDGDHVLVSSYDDIHIFRYNSSGIELIQTIEFPQSFDQRQYLVANQWFAASQADFADTERNKGLCYFV